MKEINTKKKKKAENPRKENMLLHCLLEGDIDYEDGIKKEESIEETHLNRGF